MREKQIAASKRWREQNPEKWKEINRRNQTKWMKERAIDKMLEKHEESLAHDPERLSTAFLQKLILDRRKNKEVENGA